MNRMFTTGHRLRQESSYLAVLVGPPEGEVRDLGPDELHLWELLQLHHHGGEDLVGQWAINLP